MESNQDRVIEQDILRIIEGDYTDTDTTNYDLPIGLDAPTFVREEQTIKDKLS